MKYKNIGRCDYIISPNLVLDDAGELTLNNCDGLIKHKLVVSKDGRKLITRTLCDAHIPKTVERYGSIPGVKLTFSCAVQSQRSRPRAV